MGPTETLANYAVEAKFRDFPEEVVQRVKWLILDEIGCGLGGAQTDVGKRHIEVAKYLSDKTESTIIGDGIKVSCLNAVLCNTDLCNVLDYDDTFMYVPSHPGGPVILPALAVAEMVGSSAEEVMSAIIVGYEVSLRVARAIRCTYVNPEGKRDVFMTTSWYLFGPPVVVARLLGMTKSEVINALGIAGGQPLGWRGRYSFSRGGSSLKGVGDVKYYQGLAAFLGTLAALRAYKGVTGPEDILDGERFWQGTGANNCNYLELTMDLGEKYRLMEVGFKHTPSCRWTHAPLTAVEDALKGENLAPGDIEEIVLIGTPRLMNYEWETMMDAEFSIPCIVAMDIAGGEPGPTWYTTGRFKDPDIRELARKVKFIENPETIPPLLKYGQYMCEAEIRTKDGRIRKGHCEWMKGEPKNPLTDDELRRKFIVNAVDILGQTQAEELMEKLLHFEEVDDISTLARLLYRAKE